MENFFISDHSFVHLEIGVNKPQAVIRTRRMRVFEEDEVKKELDEIGEVIKRESSIDYAVGIYSNMV